MNTLNKIIQILKHQGKQQKELADALGIQKNNITDWKTGKSKSYTKYLPQIASFLGVSVDYLVGSVGSIDSELFRRLDNLCKKQGISFMEAMQKAGFTDEEIEKYYSGHRGIIFTKQKELAEVLNDDVNAWNGITFVEPKEKPSVDGELDELDHEIIKLFSSLSDEKKKAALNYIAFLTQQENGEN